MAIIIKELVIKGRVNRNLSNAKLSEEISSELIQKLKKEIIESCKEEILEELERRLAK